MSEFPTRWYHLGRASWLVPKLLLIIIIISPMNNLHIRCFMQIISARSVKVVIWCSTILNARKWITGKLFQLQMTNYFFFRKATPGQIPNLDIYIKYKRIKEWIKHPRNVHRVSGSCLLYPHSNTVICQMYFYKVKHHFLLSKTLLFTK